MFWREVGIQDFYRSEVILPFKESGRKNAIEVMELLDLGFVSVNLAFPFCPTFKVIG